MNNELAAKHWPNLVIRHTSGGACNFQSAANELAEIVAYAERAECAKICRDKKPFGNMADDWAAQLLEGAARDIEARSNAVLTGAARQE